jgi:predicted homoserine dehydrogenase-like protein
MNYHQYFGHRDKPVETCLVGTGDFGRSYLRQAQKAKLLSARIAVDVSADRAAEALASIGIERNSIEPCETAAQAKTAWMRGKHVAAGDLAAVIDLPIEVVIEATGHPEAGARHAMLAVDSGRHLALVSKEVDIVVGPVLSALARDRGRVVTPIDGDQPSLLMGLVTWAEVLGLTIIAAGKSSEYDFIYDERSSRLFCNGREQHLPEIAKAWTDDGRSIAELTAERARVAAAFSLRTVPDLCEMLITANAVDLAPDRPDFHSPLLRIAEVPTAFSDAKEAGGLLQGERRVDVFNCLRRPDEASFAGGVFVVVRCEDPAAWRILREKGHVLGRDDRTALIYLPRHLLGLEAATSILEAGVLGVSSGGQTPQPRFDLALRATADLKAGTVLTASGHHHSIEGAEGYAVPGRALGPDVPIPYYLAANRRLLRSVAQGDLVRCEDVDIADDSDLAVLRRRQDKLFFN